MFKKQLSHIVVGLVLSLVVVNVAHAEDDKSKSYIGALIGLNIPNSGDNAVMAYGATIGTKLAPNFGVGVLGSFFGRMSSGNFLGLPVGSSTSEAFLLGQASFFVEGFHIGAEIGAEIDSWSGNISSASTGSSSTSMIFGPQAGVDFKVADTVSVGVDAHYLINSSNNNVSNIQALASVKLWM